MEAGTLNARAAVTALRRRMPGPVKAVARGMAGVVDPVRVQRFRQAEGVTTPIPPRRLRTRIGSITPADYVANGRLVADRIAAATALAGRSLDSFSAVLDFGCGTGRVLDHVAPRLAPGATVHGVDVDSESIAWAQAQGRPVQFGVSGYTPPLDFPAASFDLVYAISVFTHLDREKEQAWLEELRRVLRPDGVAMLTVLGSALYDRVRTTGDALGVTQPMVDIARRHGALEDEGLVFLPYARRGTAAQGSPDMGDEDYGLTFHGEQYLQETWGRWFEIVARVPRCINVHQDAVLLLPR